MKVTLVQMNSGGDKARLANARALIERAVVQERRTGFVYLVFDFIGGSRAEKIAAAEELPGGPAYQMCQALAREHKVPMHAGSILEKAPGERLHNTSVAFNREGGEVARYRKIPCSTSRSPTGEISRERRV
jgi:nitrilase